MGLLDFFRKKEQNPLEPLLGSGNGARLDQIPGCHGEFGLTPTNPIPVDGIVAIKVYLGFLMTPDGQRIKFKRVKSIEGPQFSGPSDEYDILDQSETFLTKLYINAYCKGTSEKAPRGFTYFRPFKGLMNK